MILKSHHHFLMKQETTYSDLKLWLQKCYVESLLTYSFTIDRILNSTYRKPIFSFHCNKTCRKQGNKQREWMMANSKEATSIWNSAEKIASYQKKSIKSDLFSLKYWKIFLSYIKLRSSRPEVLCNNAF